MGSSSESVSHPERNQWQLPTKTIKQLRPHNIDLPKINKEQITIITTGHKAIQHMRNNEAWCPDGFPADFYKVLWPTIAPSFYRIVTVIEERGIFYLGLKPQSPSSKIGNNYPLFYTTQTGFIKGRHSTSNTCRLINVTDYTNTHSLQAMVVLLDAEKAFDRVHWKFLCYITYIWIRRLLDVLNQNATQLSLQRLR